MKPMAICGNVDRVLAEVSSGVVGSQVESEGIRVTVIVSPVMDNLSGKALRALRPFPVFVTDQIWGRVIGYVFTVPGGTEMVVDSDAFEALTKEHEPETIPDSAMIQVILNDTALPPAKVTIRQMDIEHRCQITGPNTGPRAIEQPKPCSHMMLDTSCPSCISAWWKSRAKIMGVEPV